MFMSMSMCSDPMMDNFMEKFGAFIHPKDSVKLQSTKGGKVKAMSYKHGPKESHPPCKGQCMSGKCEFDRSHDGCCTLSRRKPYGNAVKTAAAGSGRSNAEAQEQVLKAIKGGVLCWEGKESSKAQ
jgi:hypothetical protein